MTLLLLGMSVATLALAERVLPDSGLTAMATMGVVLAGMSLPHAAEVRAFEDELSRILQAMRALVAGAGTIARRVGAQLSAGGFDVVLVDPDGGAATAARREGLQAELGDAADVQLMERLGAREAEMAIAATNSDETNLLFSQYVLAENPEASVFARVAQGRAVEAFRRSGIHTVGEGEAIAEAMMATIGQPVLHDALGPDGHDRLMVEFEVGSGLDRRRVRDLGLPSRVLVLLVRRTDDDLIPNGDTVLARGNRLLLYGTTDAAREARSRLALIE